MDENGSVVLLSAITAAAAVMEAVVSTDEVPAFASAFSICVLAVALVVLAWKTGGRT